LVKQSSADDWLGLGAETPIEPPAKPMSQTLASSRPASKSAVKPSPGNYISNFNVKVVCND